MRKELIEKLFIEFEKDKNTIKRNLLEAMDVVVLQTNDNYGTVKLTITYERNDKNETNNN